MKLSELIEGMSESERRRWDRGTWMTKVLTMPIVVGALATAAGWSFPACVVITLLAVRVGLKWAKTK